MIASVPVFKRRFICTWPMTLLALSMMLVLVLLGFWQIVRAQQKQTMLTTQLQLSQQPAHNWEPAMSLPLQYQPLILNGRFLPFTLLLDNQYYQHQFGYQVLTPLLLADESIVLVDRGWIMGDISRRKWPQIEIPQQTNLSVEGSAYFPAVKGFILGQASEKKRSDLVVIERVDVPLLQQLLHKSVHPFIIRLNKNAEYGFIRDWPVVSMSPSRHYGYAVQWFAMALTVLIGWILLSLKKVEEKD